MSRSDVVIYHNPACGTSRNTLALLRAQGVEPTVVPYLKVGWTSAQLQDLAARSGGSLRDLLRKRGAQAHALGLTDAATPESALLAAMINDPSLVDRPIVATEKGVAVCRPPERALGLL